MGEAIPVCDTIVEEAEITFPQVADYLDGAK